MSLSEAAPGELADQEWDYQEEDASLRGRMPFDRFISNRLRGANHQPEIAALKAAGNCHRLGGVFLVVMVVARATPPRVIGKTECTSLVSNTSARSYVHRILFHVFFLYLFNVFFSLIVQLVVTDTLARFFSFHPFQNVFFCRFKTKFGPFS